MDEASTTATQQRHASTGAPQGAQVGASEAAHRCGAASAQDSAGPAELQGQLCEATQKVNGLAAALKESQEQCEALRQHAAALTVERDSAEKRAETLSQELGESSATEAAYHDDKHALEAAFTAAKHESEQRIAELGEQLRCEQVARTAAEEKVGWLQDEVAQLQGQLQRTEDSRQAAEGRATHAEQRCTALDAEVATLIQQQALPLLHPQPLSGCPGFGPSEGGGSPAWLLCTSDRLCAQDNFAQSAGAREREERAQEARAAQLHKEEAGPWAVPCCASLACRGARPSCSARPSVCSTRRRRSVARWRRSSGSWSWPCCTRARRPLSPRVLAPTTDPRRPTLERCASAISRRRRPLHHTLSTHSARRPRRAHRPPPASTRPRIAACSPTSCARALDPRCGCSTTVAVPLPVAPPRPLTRALGLGRLATTRVFLFPNDGGVEVAGKMLMINDSRTLLDGATKKLQLPWAARRFFTEDGQEVPHCRPAASGPSVLSLLR